MNIIITGSSGFIGSKLSYELKRIGHNVIGIDKNEGINTSVVKDISDESFINFNPKCKIDIIYHLAAQSGGYRSLIDPFIDAKWNCLGTVNLISFSKKQKIKKFIYISSMAVYGNKQNVSEETLINPISFYGVSKYAGELQTKVLKIHNNIDYSIFRLFATYGAGQDLENNHQGILSIYLAQALKSNTIKITGKKDRVRELIHVNDVINALIFGLNESSNNQVFNVTNSLPITPEYIINEISKQLNKKLNIKEIEGYPGDQTYITSKKSRLYKYGWTPLINLQQGIHEFLTNK